MYYRKLYIKYIIPLDDCVVGINVDPRDVCVSCKVVVVMVFLCDVKKILGDVGMVFGDVIGLLGKVVVIFCDVDKISGDVGVVFGEVTGLSGSVVQYICSVEEFESEIVKLCSVDNFSGEVRLVVVVFVVVVVEPSNTIEVMLCDEEERYGEIVVVFSDVNEVTGKAVWVT